MEWYDENIKYCNAMYERKQDMHIEEVYIKDLSMDLFKL